MAAPLLCIDIGGCGAVEVGVRLSALQARNERHVGLRKMVSCSVIAAQSPLRAPHLQIPLYSVAKPGTTRTGEGSRSSWAPPVAKGHDRSSFSRCVRGS
jgi:hypothetical protein